MSPREHLLVRASAGTGKTFELSSRYLGLLLDGVDPNRILATTFTRKAAHEIQDRILRRLADAAAHETKRAELSDSIGREVSAEECLEHLEKLLRGLDRVRIGTIDAWFGQLARLFALDLGLPPAWRILDEAESESLRSEAVAEAVAGADRVELLDLLRDFQSQAVGQGAHEILLSFAREGRKLLLDSTEEAWNRIHMLPDADEKTIAAAVESLPRMPLPRTKAGTERHHWVRARDKIAAALQRGDWTACLEESLVQRLLAGALFDREPIGKEHQAILRPIADHALHLVTRDLVLENAASRRLLERYEESHRSLSRERGLLGFEDLPNALAPVTGVDTLAARGVDLESRIDGRIDHLLLDEFQDTSPVQWRVLRPVAEEILRVTDGERTFFCVGDVKQSIYGWRAAEPRLLRDFGVRRPSLETKQLPKSFRSSRAVLGTVNLVFTTIAQNPAFEEKDDEIRAAAEEFEQSFLEHVPARQRPGAAFLVRAPAAGEGEATHVPVLRVAVERVRSILDEAPGASVGVLVRRRAWIPDLIRRLRAVGIQASDEGGNPLTDSTAVLHALSLLWLADHPGDSAAAFHVATSPLGSRVGLEPDAFRERAEEVARKVRADLAALGYGGFLASIRPGHGASGYEGRDLDRYDQLVDLALAFEARASSRPGAFVDHVRKTKVDDPNAAQVRVMTVHGAKGLEFHAVVLPELDRSMLRSGKSLLSSRPDPEGPLGVVTHGIAKELAPAHAALDAVRRDVVQRRMVEELCVLYVAMTRAVHRLDLIVQTKDKKGATLSNAAILRRAFDLDAAGLEGVAWTHPENQDPWFPPELGPRDSASEPSAVPEARALRLAPSRRARSAATRSPSSAKDAGPVLADRLLQPRDAITARGRILHRLLQEVEWLDTFRGTDDELLAIARQVDPDPELVAASVAEFRAALRSPGLRSVLERPNGEVSAWRERPFSLFLTDEDGVEILWSGAFDRVVLRSRGGKPVSVDLVDFKTDRVEGQALEERVRGYRPQMLAYRRALTVITGLAESAIRLRLAFTTSDVVVEL